MQIFLLLFYFGIPYQSTIFFHSFIVCIFISFNSQQEAPSIAFVNSEVLLVHKKNLDYTANFFV